MRLNKMECEDPSCENEIVGDNWNDIVWTAKDLGWEPYEPYELGEQDDRYWWCPPHKLDKRFSFPVWHWTCSECNDVGQELTKDEANKSADWHRKEDCLYRDSVVNVMDHDAWLKVEAEREVRQQQWREKEEVRKAEAAVEAAKMLAQRQRNDELIEKGKRYERLWWVRLIETFKRSGVS